MLCYPRIDEVCWGECVNIGNAIYLKFRGIVKGEDILEPAYESGYAGKNWKVS